MFFVANVFEPLQQKSFGIFGAMGALGTVFQVIHEAAKFVQTAHGTSRQLGPQTV